MTSGKILVIFAAFLSIVISGCAHMLSDRGSEVYIENDEALIKECRPMGMVKGSAMRGLTKAQKMEWALNELRNKAALLGANTVFIVSSGSMFEGTVVTGRAYDCPARSLTDGD